MNPALYSVFYVLASAIATVTVDHLVSNIPSTLVLFLVTSIAIIYFHLINIRKLATIYRSIKSTPVISVIVNLSLAATWLGTYIGIQHLGATLFNIFFFTTTAMLACIVDSKNNKHLILLAATLIAATVLLHLPRLAAIICVAAGTCGFIYIKCSYRLSQKTDLTSSQILAMRFWLLWLFLLCVAPLSQLPTYLHWQTILLIIIVAFISFIVQNWLNQQGIVKAGVKTSTFIISWTPLATLLCQWTLLSEFKLSWFIFALCCQALLLLTRNGGTRLMKLRIKKDVNRR